MKPAPFRPRALRLLRRQRQGAVSRSRSVTVWEFRQKQVTGLRLPWKAHSLSLAYAVALAWPREGRQPGTRGAEGSDPVRSCARPAAQSPRLTARCPCHLRQSASIFKLLRDIWSCPKHPYGRVFHDERSPRSGTCFLVLSKTSMRRDAWSTLIHLPLATCHDRLGHRARRVTAGHPTTAQSQVQ